MTANRRLLLYKLVLIAAALALLLFPGTADRQPQIDSRVMITALGIDAGGEGIKLTASVSVAKKEAEGGGKEAVASAEGENLGDALNNLSRALGKKAELAHCGLIAVGDELCCSSLKDSVDYLVISGVISDGASIVAADGEAKSLIETAVKLSGSAAFSLNSFLAFAGEDAQIPMVSLVRFAANNNTAGKSSYLPLIKMGAEGEGQGGSQSGESGSKQGGESEKDENGLGGGQSGKNGGGKTKDNKSGGDISKENPQSSEGGNKSQDGGGKSGESGKPAGASKEDSQGEEKQQSGSDKGKEKDKKEGGGQGQNEADGGEQESQSKGADSGKEAQAGKEAQIVSSDKTVIFKDYRKVCVFDKEDTFALTWLDPQSDRGLVGLDSFKFDGKEVSGFTFRMRKKSVKIKAAFEGDKARITVAVNVKLEGEDNHKLRRLVNEGYTQKQVNEALRRALVRRFDSQIKGGYESGAKNGVDPFKFGFALYKKNPKKFDALIGDDYDRLFVKLILDTDILILLI